MTDPGNGRQCPVQYVSRTLNEAERNYSPLEKLALSLVNMTRRLRRYFEAHPVKVITDQPIKNILSRTEVSGKLAKYAVEIGTYKISFIPRNAVKGQVLADFLSDAPDGEREDEYFQSPEVPPEIDDTEAWTLYTDGAASSKGSGAGLVLTGPSGAEYAYALRLTFASTNNEAEYEALLAGLRIARMMNVLWIEVKVDSKLVASQINGIYEASNDSMIKYLAKARDHLAVFHNLTRKILVEVLNERSTEVQEVQTIIEEEGDNWMTPIIKYLEEGIVPSDKNEARALRAKIGQYTIESGVLRAVVGSNKTRFTIGATMTVQMQNGELESCPTAPHQANNARPTSANLREEAVIPAEIGIPSYRTLMIREEFNEEEQRLNLDLLQERREAAAVREARYKSKMEQYYNKKVRPAGFRPGEFVYRRNEASRVEDQGKLGPKWEGPYRVTEAFENGSYKLQTMEDKIVPRTWHAINLRKCYL
ncbi:reverse transcriptase domain-containing protein [Tanacetum coccineum]